MNPWVVGVCSGLGAGLGVLVVLRALAARRPSLVARVSPYLRARSATSGLLAEDDAPGRLAAALALVLPDPATVERALARLGASRDDVARRIRRADLPWTVEAFRLRQVVVGCLGLAGGLAAAVLLAVLRDAQPVPLVLLVGLCGLLGVLGCDRDLTARARARESRMLEEFPTFAELVALAVGAGEGPAASIERVARSMRGELAREFVRVAAEVHAGVGLTDALEALAGRTGLPSLARFAETVAVAVARGTPLAHVLRAQAQDVRDAGRAALMETGGKKEVLMMVPVVLLVLPVTVVFAVFPGISTLQVGL
ncbi:tight adherence protein C [Sediminihabitans luteus]|uniref:Tight adherence protein C n=1 Tax=Sediminihabitans luteus TaxID=1138585 RepID=A0A2M9CYB8_9CELL|nr:type II secretion system F family protein [Sediminihabitans luteus]PJJ76929.1 tight adherence protein C [Sediminihabitans luteus]GII99570.1 pilus assembly protein TadB [Sediminihabitans luteus]